MAGYYCIGGSWSKTPTDNRTGRACPEGKYCVEGTESPENCPRGTFANITGLKTKNDCLPCTAGMYCDRPGLVKPYGKCSAKYYCSEGSDMATPSGGACTPGNYCPEGSPEPFPCDVSSIYCSTIPQYSNWVLSKGEQRMYK